MDLADLEKHRKALLDDERDLYLYSGRIVLFGRGIQFVGCYSGRIGSREDQAALGLCWREDAISKICASKVRGQHPHLV